MNDDVLRETLLHRSLDVSAPPDLLERVARHDRRRSRRRVLGGGAVVAATAAVIGVAVLVLPRTTDVAVPGEPAAPSSSATPTPTAAAPPVPWASDPLEWTDGRLAMSGEGSAAREAPPCRAADLRGVVRPAAAEDGVLSALTIEVQNVGSSVCSLQRSSPDGVLRAPDGSERELDPGVRSLVLPPSTHLAPDGVAVASARATAWCGSAPDGWAVVLRFPDGTVELPVAVGPSPCPPGGASAGTLTVGDWTALNDLGQPLPDPMAAVQTTITQLEPSVPLGGVLRFTVRLTNPTAGPVSLEPCPSFAVSFRWRETADTVAAAHRLNCAAAPDELPPHSYLDFQMEVPAASRDVSFPLEAGPSAVSWSSPDMNRWPQPVGARADVQLLPASG